MNKMKLNRLLLNLNQSEYHHRVKKKIVFFTLWYHAILSQDDWNYKYCTVITVILMLPYASLKLRNVLYKNGIAE